jgi:small subunit ribosomal protein S1
MSDENEKSFAEMFGKGEVERERLAPGQKVAAEVVRIAKDWVFIGLGGKSEGVVAKPEFLDAEGNLQVKEGDVIQVFFLSAKNSENLFTLRLSGTAAQGHLEEVFHSGIPVEGSVVKEVKGGFEVRIAGNVRAFCPFSQMDLRRVDDATGYVGGKFPFKISEYKEGGKNIIVSRRAVLEDEREQKKDSLKETLKEGDVVVGTVTAVRDFGAFVDIGGIEGLIPVSEIAWGRVEDIRERITEGQQVEVAVKKLDWEHDRFSFSLKDRLRDPWEDVSARFSEGSCHTGKVARLTTFGAFVTLEPGIDGLVHISKLGAGRRINHPREVVQEGDSLEVRVDSIDLEKKKISLSVPAPAGSEELEPEPPKQKDGRDGKKKKPRAPERGDEDYGEYLQKTAGKGSGSLGTFGDLLKGKLKDSK